MSVMLALSGCGKMEKKAERVADRVEDRLDGREGKSEGRDGKAGKRAERAGRDAQGALPDFSDACNVGEQGGMYSYDMPFQGMTTPTKVYVPTKAGPHTMVVLLHGGEGDSDSILEQTGYTRIADDEGIVIVAPSGAGGGGDGKLNWNVKDDPGMKRNDVAYLDALVASLKSKTCSQKVVIVGFSNGSMMTNRWLCQGKEPMAAVTAAGMVGIDMTKCQGPRPYKNYAGTDDDQFSGPPPNTSQAVELRASANGCKGEPTVTKNGKRTDRVWSGCAAPVEQTILDGFPHGYPHPGGKYETDVDATAEGWTWLKRVLP